VIGSNKQYLQKTPNTSRKLDGLFVFMAVSRCPPIIINGTKFPAKDKVGNNVQLWRRLPVERHRVKLIANDLAQRFQRGRNGELCLFICGSAPEKTK